MHIPKDITNEQIISLIQQYLPLALQKQGFICAITGYDDDKRELYQIPEAIELFKRLCNTGFISVLHVSTLLDENHPEISRLFGALEIWAIKEGYLDSSGNFNVNQEIFDKFTVELNKSNKIADEQMPTIKDGAHLLKL